MMNKETLENIRLTGQTLGYLLYYPPSGKELKNIRPLLAMENALYGWPWLTESESQTLHTRLQAGLADPDGTEEAYKRLFVGPDHLPAPPWGSVYLDREKVIFGDSTLRLRHWMREHHIEPLTEGREPEDHIGLMLMLAAWIAINQPERLKEYLTDHLLPWAPRFAERLEEKACNPFYKAIARLTSSTLKGWQTDLDITPAGLKLYS